MQISVVSVHQVLLYLVRGKVDIKITIKRPTPRTVISRLNVITSSLKYEETIVNLYKCPSLSDNSPILDRSPLV